MAQFNSRGALYGRLLLMILYNKLQAQSATFCGSCKADGIYHDTIWWSIKFIFTWDLELANNAENFDHAGF